MDGSRRPAFASEDWMLEQQVRAELEAEAWRRLRQDMAKAPALPPPEPAPLAPAPRFNPHRAGSAVLKAIARFALAACGCYLAWLAALDSGLGEFEIWLASGAGFLVSLSLTMLGPARAFVHALAETLRWVLVAGAAVGLLWLVVQGLP